MSTGSFTEKLFSANDLTTILDQVMAEIKYLSHADGVIFTLEHDGGYSSKGLLLPQDFQLVGETYLNIKFPKVVNPEDPGDVFFIDENNIDAVDPFIKDRFEKWAMKSLWAFPLQINGKFLGNLFIFYGHASNDFSLIDQALSVVDKCLQQTLTLITNHNELAELRNQKAKIEHQEKRNTYFFEAISTINNISNSKEMYDTLLKEFLKITGFDFALIYLQKGQQLLPEAVYYTNLKFKPISERFLNYLKDNPYNLVPEDGTVPTAFLHKEHFFFPDIFKIIHMQMSEKSRRVLEIMGTPRSAFHTPVLHQGKPIGVLTLGSLENPVELSEDDIQKITLLASFVGSAIKNAALYTEIENLNKTLESRVAEQTAEIQNRLQKYAALSDFLSNMSHELRTPMNAILGFTQLLSYETTLTPVQNENIEEIRRASEHLLDLINDVLDLSRIESGRMALSLEPVQPRRVINDCLRLMDPLAKVHNITLEANFNGEDKTFIQADCMRLRQSLLNLISNAVKYNKPKGKVILELTKLNADDTLEIAVEDTGIGIPVLRQQEVFQPFNRLGAEAGNIEGNGVGLLITKRLVELMRGEIGFVSHQGQGSRFYIRLPILPNHTEEIISEGANQEFLGKNEKITLEEYKSVLYIEDNQSNIRVMQQLFTHYPNLSLDIAEEAVMGLYKARMNKPDLIILDINLPGMDGFETLTILKRDEVTKNIPVIALSANAMPYDIERGQQAGFDDYLTKPLNFNVLIAKINSLFSKQPADKETQ